jgi:hypothetical protein
MMKRATIAMVVMTLAPAVGADEGLPPVGDVVQKARAVMAHKPAHVTCKVHVDTELLDKTGKLEHAEKREGKATLDGDDSDIESTSVVRDGKALSAQELADERAKLKKQQAHKKKGGDDDFEISPLDAKNAPDERFELMRKETLWGHPAYVVRVTAQKSTGSLANGTLWIDADRFVELKGELVPAELPSHADWVKVLEQYELGDNQAPLPALLHIEGAGHLLFMHKQFRTTLRWSDCR